MRITPLLFACLVFTAAPVAAQPGTPARSAPAEKASEGVRDAGCDALHRAGVRCKSLDISGDDVDGARPTATGDALTGRTAVGYTSLLRLRTSFRDRVLRAADALP